MTPERFATFDKVLMKIANNISEMSLATRAKVGAILFKDGNIISMGWNGMPSGFNNDDIEQLQPDGSLVTNQLALHAESNALMKCAASGGVTSRGATLYVTMSPCKECCKLIIQARISKVIYETEYRDKSSIAILQQAGIETIYLPKGEQHGA